MLDNNEKFTNKYNFYGKYTPQELLDTHGSPLYVYNEVILRERCRELKNLVSYKNFTPHYSVKANSNLHLLGIIREEGLHADVMSPGELYVALKAGFKSDELFFIPNNVSDNEMQYAIDYNILTSMDSVSQLVRYGKLNPGGKVAIRFNPGVGAGHCDKVVTGGENTKFGVNIADIDQVKRTLEEYNLTLTGINQHIGSLFMESTPYIDGIKSILTIAKQFDDLEFVDLGGGFGIPYHKQDGEERLDLKLLGQELDKVINEFVLDYGKEINIQIEPGRYISAECGVLLGTVNTIKHSYNRKYVGTDLGFNILQRPILYGSHHDIEVYPQNEPSLLPGGSPKTEVVTVVGNICESGDILAENRTLPEIFEGDILGVMDAGAYAFSMASNYNNRLRPAEILISADGHKNLIRKRDTLEDIVRHF
ncbi:MAG TPA: diaminopimelate decarboxylase [Epulopiscium sp.]|nr:diaminopimelate decarboxylase [Candidatus Epulonipiscium sp.]